MQAWGCYCKGLDSVGEFNTQGDFAAIAKQLWHLSHASYTQKYKKNSLEDR